MSALNEVANAMLRKAFGNSCIIKGAIAINAGGAATIKTTGALTYGVDGILYNKNALAAQSIAVTHDAFGNVVGGQNLPAYVQPGGTSVYYLLCLNAAGNVAVVQGTYLNQAMQYPDNQRTLVGTGNVPQWEPAGYTAFGLIKVVTGAAVPFTPGTTPLDTAGLVVTYLDLEYIPTNLQP